MNVVLGIETSTPVSSVALATDGAVTSSVQIEGGRGHVEFLMPTIIQLLADASLTFADVSLVAVGVGPGLFTGMRVGITTAVSIAHVLGVKVAGVTSLDNLAYQAREDDRTCCPCIDARRAEVFAAFARAGVTITEPASWAPAALAAAVDEPTLFLGDGAIAYAGVFSPKGEVRAASPTAAVLCEIALARGEAMEPSRVEPLYVRKSEAEIKWDARGVEPLRPHRVKMAGER